MERWLRGTEILMGTVEGDFGTELPPYAHRPSQPSPENTKMIRYFQNCQDKQSVLDGMLNFVRPYFENCAVFAIQQNKLTWLMGEGSNLQGQSAMPPIALAGDTVVCRCIMERNPYNGPIPLGSDERKLFLSFLQEIPSGCLLYPTAIGDVTDCLIYAEGPKIDRADATERLEFIIGKGVLALRRMLIERLMIQHT
jgi:hypothetical protein